MFLHALILLLIFLHAPDWGYREGHKTITVTALFQEATAVRRLSIGGQLRANSLPRAITPILFSSDSQRESEDTYCIRGPKMSTNIFFAQTFSTPAGVRDIPAKFRGHPGDRVSLPQISNWGQKINATFFGTKFFDNPRVMDVRAENHGRPHQKVHSPAAPVVGRNLLTPGHPSVRIRNVCGKPKVCVYVVFLP